MSNSSRDDNAVCVYVVYLDFESYTYLLGRTEKSIGKLVEKRNYDGI